MASATHKTRIIGLDIARALAILGMVLVNFKIVMDANHGHAGLAWALHAFEGRAVALFIVLAGMGITLMTRKAVASGDIAQINAKRYKLLKRALFLFVVGLLYSPIWPADILHFYGVYLLIATAVLLAPGHHLWYYALGAMIVSVLLMLTLDYSVGWDFDTLSYNDFYTPIGMVRHLIYNGFHPVFPWVALMLIGMWFGRQHLTQHAVRQHLLKIAIVVAVITESLSVMLVTVIGKGSDDALLFTTSPLPPTPLYIIAGAAWAIIVIIICLMVTERFPGGYWFPLTATGQLALTLYIAHVLIGMGALEAFGWIGQQSYAHVWLASLSFYMGAVLFATLWRLRFQRGPVEWLLHRLTD